MSALMYVGTCCMLISVWGFLQLTIMSLCYYSEAVTLIEDCEQEDKYEDYDDYIKKTQDNYSATAINCLIAAIVYAVLIFVSYGCVIRGRQQMLEKAKIHGNDELFCTPKEVKATPPSKVK